MTFIFISGLTQSPPASATPGLGAWESRRASPALGHGEGRETLQKCILERPESTVPPQTCCLPAGVTQCGFCLLLIVKLLMLPHKYTYAFATHNSALIPSKVAESHFAEGFFFFLSAAPYPPGKAFSN